MALIVDCSVTYSTTSPCIGASRARKCNLSGRLVGDAAFIDLTISLIEDTGANICLEITETAAMSEPEAALRSIDRYAAAGVWISIDDYGAGFSSLSYLKRIRAHELRTDSA